MEAEGTLRQPGRRVAGSKLRRKSAFTLAICPSCRAKLIATFF